MKTWLESIRKQVDMCTYDRQRIPGRSGNVHNHWIRTLHFSPLTYFYGHQIKNSKIAWTSSM